MLMLARKNDKVSSVPLFKKNHLTGKLIFNLVFIFIFPFLSSAQTIGSKVSFKGTDGRTYTGVIKEIKGSQYKIKYNSYDYEAWAQQSQFTLLNNTNANIISISTRVSFPGTDGTTYTGIIKEIQGN